MCMAEIATLTLTEFLLARITEDEAAARAVEEWNPEAVLNGKPLASKLLAECGAKRRIVESHHPKPAQPDTWFWLERACAGCGHGWHKWLPNEIPTVIGPEKGCPTLRAIAAVYADHPDYREEWRP